MKAGGLQNGKAHPDPRFEHRKDPRFRRPPVKEVKVKLDSRFSSLLKDNKFSVNRFADATGRTLGKDSKVDMDLSEYYQAAESDGNDDNIREHHARPRRVEDGDGDADATTADDGDVDDASSGVDDDDDDVDAEGGRDNDAWNSERLNAPTGDESSRIAVTGCNWDIVSASDLFVLFKNCPTTTGGATGGPVVVGGGESGVGDGLLKVSVYLSDFGAERLEREKVEGPRLDLPTTTRAGESTAEDDEEKDEENDDDDDDDIEDDEADEVVEEESDEDDDGDYDDGLVRMDDDEMKEMIKKKFGRSQKIDADSLSPEETEALRKYQKERSRYHYAVMEFESAAHAARLYNEMDGADQDFFLDSIDLRFVPDGLEFPREPIDVCSEIPSNYKAPIVSESGLKHCGVKLSWDENTPKRTKVLTKRFTDKELEELELEEYLASDEDSDGEGNRAVVEDEWTKMPEILRKLEGLPDDDDGTLQVDDEEEERERMKTFAAEVRAAAGQDGDDEEDDEDVEGEEYMRRLLEEETKGEEAGDNEDDGSGPMMGRASERGVRGNGEVKRLRKGEVEVKFNPNLEIMAKEVSEKAMARKMNPQKGNAVNHQDDERGLWEKQLDKKREKKKEKKRERRRQQRQEEEEALKQKEELAQRSTVDKKGFPVIDTTFESSPRKFAEADAVEGKASKKGKQKVESKDNDDDDDDDNDFGDGHVEMNPKRLTRELKGKLKDKKISKRQLRKAVAASVQKEQSGSIDYDDPRFSAVFSNPDFAVDPTNPSFAGDLQANREMIAKGSKRKLSSSLSPAVSPTKTISPATKKRRKGV